MPEEAKRVARSRPEHRPAVEAAVNIDRHGAAPHAVAVGDPSINSPDIAGHHLNGPSAADDEQTAHQRQATTCNVSSCAPVKRCRAPPMTILTAAAAEVRLIVGRKDCVHQVERGCSSSRFTVRDVGHPEGFPHGVQRTTVRFAS